MISLRGLGTRSSLIRHAICVSRYTSTHRQLLETPLHLPCLAKSQFQIRTVFRGALVTPNPADTKRASKQRYSRLINDEIDAEIIQTVNQDGQLDVPTRKSNVLVSLRRNEQVLVQLDPGSNGRPAVCKVMSLNEFREQERSKEKASRLAKHTAKTSSKQIELNWSIDPHDLSHRLKKLSSFIEKGRTVEIVLTRKRHKRMATADEIKHLMDSIRTAIEEANAHQTKSMDGEIGKTLTITVEKKS